VNLVETIIAKHTGHSSVSPGQFVGATVDLVMCNDGTAPLAIGAFRQLGATHVFDPSRVVFVLDHFCPSRDVASARQNKLIAEFARAQGAFLYDVGKGGIEHVVLPEDGWALPGQLVVGADSHTTTYGAVGCLSIGIGSTDAALAMATGQVWLRVPETLAVYLRGNVSRWVGGKDIALGLLGKIGLNGANYRAIEFRGPDVAQLTMAARFTIANMCAECGAKAALFSFDAVTRDYLTGRARWDYEVTEATMDTSCASRLDLELQDIEPLVAIPHSPSRVRAAREMSGLAVDQVVIGSCTNGRLEDLMVAAEVMRGRSVHEHVRCIVIPGSQQVYLEALRLGLLEIFVSSGAAVSTPTCGPCLGAHTGVIAEGERCVATTNRNFPGRMGSTESEVLLAGPAVAAASAIAGHIADPREIAE